MVTLLLCSTVVAGDSGTAWICPTWVEATKPRYGSPKGDTIDVCLPTISLAHSSLPVSSPPHPETHAAHLTS
jgi:hypothetical protein